ncbi:hypothetical protein SLS55_001711 [Diplodia seriata]|uniref:Uncharacterized protein n=1 Tax=Diplodia seriata TaxID=420778 RepID=A0ABR3CQ30_9PEZI
MMYGGTVWSKIGPIRTYDFAGYSLARDSSYWFLNRSDECQGKEILFVSTPLFELDEDGQLPEDLSFLPNSSTSVQACSSHNYIGNANITASLSASASRIDFDREEYLRRRSKIPESMLNFDAVQNVTLSASWYDYLPTPQHQVRSSGDDLSILLAAQYNFDMAAMVQDEDLITHATIVKQRVLSEAMQYSVQQPGASRTDYIAGSVTNLSDTSTWNVSRNPDGAEIGYLIGSQHPLDEDSEFVDTTVEGHLTKVKCCVNETDGQPGKGSAIGYWSQNNIVEYNSRHAPMNFTTKWIHGDAVIGSYDEPVGSGSIETHERLLFIDKPQAAALHCVPSIETADANVVVDREGRVQTFSITGDPTATDAPWEDEFVVYLNANDLDHVNVTASYGILFQESLLSSSHITRVSPDTTSAVPDEDASDRAFNVRDRTRGLNLDFMTEGT